MVVLDRAVRRLLDTEACLRALDDSMQELRSGERSRFIASGNEHDASRLFRSPKVQIIVVLGIALVSDVCRLSYSSVLALLGTGNLFYHTRPM